MDSKEKCQPGRSGNSQGIEENQSINNIRHEDTKYPIQIKRVFKAFWGEPISMLQAEAMTGVMRSNITWYVNDWLKTKSIQRVKTGICPLTKMKVGKYSTNPKYWKKGGDNG
jgi:hypothetical protein